MAIEEVEVRIGTDGKVEIVAKGFTDDACLAATQAAEEALGGDGAVESRRRTASGPKRQLGQTQQDRLRRGDG